MVEQKESGGGGAAKKTTAAKENGKEKPAPETAAASSSTAACGGHAGHVCLSNVHANLPVQKVVVHPLVLLSVIDHLNRMSKSQMVNRVVGVLLGQLRADKSVHVTNSFAVPFDEDDRDGATWFLDGDYLDSMYGMFHKVAASELIVGWYHTGPKLSRNDIAINQVVKRWTTTPVLVVVDAEAHAQLGLPFEAYFEVEEVHDDGTPPVRTFEHVPVEMGAEEAEEVGVEHLLRDIKDQRAGTLSQRITEQVFGLRGLGQQLDSIVDYLREVTETKLPVNQPIIYLIQEVLNLLPDVLAPELDKSLIEQANDQQLMIYLGSLVRSVTALQDLIDNKLSLQKADEEKDATLTKAAEAKKEENATENGEAKEVEGNKENGTNQK